MPTSRTAAQRRSRRLAKTDASDAVAAARALLAEPTLGPVQVLEVFDPLVAKIEAVLEHRQALVAARTLMLHHIGDQITKLPTAIRDQLSATGKIESRLRRLEHTDTPALCTEAGYYRLGWLTRFIDYDKAARREIRRLERFIDELLDEHGTTLLKEPGVGRSPQRRSGARSVTQPGSRPNRSSLDGGGLEPSHSHRPKARPRR